MKVLQVNTHVNIGGIANYILTLSEALKLKGVDIVVASAGGNLESELKKRGIPHRFLNIRTKFEFAPKVIASGFKMARLVKDEGIDLIHAHTRVSQVASRIASRLTGVPYLTTCHGYFGVRSRKLFDTWGAKVIAISDAVALHLSEDLGVDSGRVEIIYSGVDSNRFAKAYSDNEKAVIRHELGLGAGPVIGTIGRLSSVKGHKFLIEAMAEVIKKRRDAEALIVGDGEERQALIREAQALGIEESVHIISSDLTTQRYLAVMDLFVFPSIKEGLGIALLEAMAAGKACVASDIGGIADIIKDPSYGILVPPGDAGAMGREIVALLEDPKRREMMGAAAKQVAAEKFSIDRMAERIKDLYREVISEKANR